MAVLFDAQSTGSTDTFGTLYDAADNYLTRNDDSGTG